MAKRKTFKGDDLSKTQQDRQSGGSRYEPWEGTKKTAKKKRAR